MKVDKVFLLIMLITIYMLLTTYLNLVGLPFSAFNIVLSFPFFIFLPGYCVIKILFPDFSLKLYEVVMYSFSLGVLMISSLGFFFFIFHCLSFVKYFVIVLPCVLYVLMKLRIKNFSKKVSSK
jgi:uncharacterized membrane protein